MRRMAPNHSPSRGKTYLYIYRNDVLNRVYVGIGSSPARAWQPHNPAVDTLRAHSDTEVFITDAPFPDRPSAEMAESAAICAAAAAGTEVLSDRDDLSALTNIAKVSSSKHLRVAVYRRDGVVRFDDLERTALVTLSFDAIGRGSTRRPVLHGGRSAQVFHKRATRFWGLSAADQRRRRKQLPDGTLPRDVERLIAVQKSTHTILGAWTLDDRQWRQTSGGWVFITRDELPELRGQQLDWCGAQPGNLLTWSPDIRAEIKA